MYITMIFGVLLCIGARVALTLREEHRSRVLENRVLGKIFRSARV